ncbi:MAG: hypothetical protein LC113_10600 [Acidobacteria bacterium]|nr:hypothetical protein [Acidobacteriota bacterium]
MSESQIFLSNKFTPTDYVEESWEGGVRVIRLVNRRNFYMFQKFVSLHLKRPASDDPIGKKFGPMLITYSAETVEDLKAHKYMGRDGWTRSECDQVMP